MVFNSFIFLWLFPLIFCVYYFIIYRTIKKCRIPKLGNYFLIAVSYGLYSKLNPAYTLILLGVTVITYLAALGIERNEDNRRKRLVVWAGLLLAALPLLVFKYYNFISTQFAILFSYVGLKIGLSGLNWAVPLGLSFFTLQAIGYLADVYLRRIKAEHNWWDYMLFVSFFPQITSGPISKASDLMPQIKANRGFDYIQVVQGLKWLLWGMFIKVVVADSLGMRTDLVFGNPEWYTGVECFLAAFFYTIQIYCDFAGYSFMALGVGMLLGFRLVNNFNNPYLSASITEFWRRWHISLSTWLKDYVYIPLGGSRCRKTKCYFNILMTFLVSGLWHGASWSFVVWGLIHGCLQIVEKMIGWQRQYTNIAVRVIHIGFTFLILVFTFIVFRMPTIGDSWNMIYKIFSDNDMHFDGFLYWFMLSMIVVLKDIGDEYNIKWLTPLHSKYRIVRWITYIVLILSIMITGVFGGQFIYAGF